MQFSFSQWFCLNDCILIDCIWLVWLYYDDACAEGAGDGRVRRGRRGGCSAFRPPRHALRARPVSPFQGALGSENLTRSDLSKCADVLFSHVRGDKPRCGSAQEAPPERGRWAIGVSRWRGGAPRRQRWTITPSRYASSRHLPAHGLPCYGRVPMPRPRHRPAGDAPPAQRGTVTPSGQSPPC